MKTKVVYSDGTVTIYEGSLEFTGFFLIVDAKHIPMIAIHYFEKVEEDEA